MAKEAIIKFLSVLKKSILILISVLVVFWVFIWNYDFVFKKKIAGEVESVQHVGVQAVVTQGGAPINPQVFSFAVAIKDRKSSEIHMASSEDRQWAAVQKGNCVIAAYFPYPPWRFYKGSTSHRARLLKNYTNCSDLPADDSIWETIRFFFLWY